MSTGAEKDHEHCNAFEKMEQYIFILNYIFEITRWEKEETDEIKQSLIYIFVQRTDR